MGRMGLLAVVVAVLAVVSATLVWSAEQAPAPAAPPAAGAQGQPAEQPKAEPAPAPGAPAAAPAGAEAPPAPAPGAPAAAPAGAEVPAAPEKVKGWTCECKWSEGTPAVRSVTLKVAANKMQMEGYWPHALLFDADAKAYYTLSIRETPPSPDEKGSIEVFADRYLWSGIDRIWRYMVDDLIEAERLKQLGPKERAASQALVKAVQTWKDPAILEVTEEKKKFAGYECVKYNLSQGEKTKGIVWVTKDLKLEAPLWTMLSYILEPRGGGLPVLRQLDLIEGVKVMCVNLEYVVFEGGNLYDRKLNFSIEKVTEAELDVADLQVPRGAQISDAVRGR